MFLLFIILLEINSTFSQDCYYDGNDFCVTQDDILAVNLLPGTILLDTLKKPEKTSVEDRFDNFTFHGTYEEAFHEMNYHRKRMNEYLCHGFMAEEIFLDVRLTRVKRLEDPSPINSVPDFLGEENVTVHEKMLSDEGSSKYKEWLQRTATLNDVYRHYIPQKKLKNRIGFKGIPHGLGEFDGEVTGFAMPAPIFPDKVGSSPDYYDTIDEMVSSPTGHHSTSHHQTHSSYMPHGEIIPVIHEEHYYHEPSHHEEEEHWHKAQNWKSKGELTIKDFFEIALTALAFLAFGLFIIHLLMSMTNTMTPTVTPGNADGNRFKREIFSSKLSYRNNAELNELSHRVLRSIEAAMVAQFDSGKCLKWTLCRDNQDSRNTDTAQRIWMPIWSIGMSWTSGRMLRHVTWSEMFNSIKASVLGLGGVDCSALYPGCDLVKEREKRRRRRRK